MRFLFAVDIRADEAPLAAQARDWAVRANARLDVVHVDTFGAFSPAFLDGALQSRLAEALERQRDSDRLDLERLLEPLPAELRGAALLRAGVPALEIGELAEQVDYDAVLVGPGRGGLSRLLLGSVSTRLIRNLQQPIVVLREGGVPEGRLLMAVDLTQPEDGLVRRAAVWAGLLRTRVDLMHVDTVRMDAEMVLEPQVKAYVAAEWDRMRRAQREQLEARADQLPAEVRGDVRVVGGSPASEIVNWAQNYRAVAVGTHGRKGVGLLVLGSVAAAVARAAPGPVMVLRAS